MSIENDPIYDAFTPDPETCLVCGEKFFVRDDYAEGNYQGIFVQDRRVPICGICSGTIQTRKVHADGHGQGWLMWLAGLTPEGRRVDRKEKSE